MIVQDIMDFYKSIVTCCMNKQEKFNVSLYRKNDKFVIDIINMTNSKQTAYLELSLLDDEIRYLCFAIRSDFIENNYIILPSFIRSERDTDKRVHKLQGNKIVLDVELNTDLERLDSNSAQNIALDKHNREVGNEIVKQFEINIDDIIASYIHCVNVLKNKDNRFVIYLYRNNGKFAIQIMEKETKRVVYFVEHKLNDDEILSIINYVRNNFIHTHYIYVPALEASASAAMRYSHTIHNTVYDLIIDINTENEMFHTAIAQNIALKAHEVETKRQIKKYYK